MFKTSLILLTLSLTTLSLPTAEPGLQERNAKGWISSYNVSNTTCKTQVGGHRPRWDSACLGFTPTTARIGGSWGAGAGFAMTSFSAWTEEDCQGEEIFMQNRTGNDAGFCQTLDDSARGSEWVSMLMWAIEDEYVGS